MRRPARARHRMAGTALVLAAALLAGACGPARPTTPPRGSVVPSSALPSPVASAGAPGGVASPRPCPARPATPPDLPWWSDRVFYEVFVRSFADSDGDGIGDLPGLTSRLDYLNDGNPTTTSDLGVTGIWLMPIAASPSYHGYDVTDYEAIEPDYGTMADFRAFLAAAHERGIAVITDFVVNHTSREHPWFEASRRGDPARADWYVWSDEHGGFGGPGGRPVWHAADGRWYYGYFWEGMPDLDLAQPEVTAEIERIARTWLELGVDGFRLDAARHLIEDGRILENTQATRDWLAAFRGEVHAAAPDALVLGEVWDATSTSARYVREGALDLVFEFGLASAMVSAVRFADPESLRIIQAEVDAAYPAGGYAAFLTNHDQDRVLDQLGRDVDAARAAATLLLTGPGVPFVYYGEEIGLRGRKPDERIRTPLPWDASGPGRGFTDGEPWQPFAEGGEEVAIAAQVDDPYSLLAHYRRLIALRATSEALRRGPLVPVEVDAPDVHAFVRHAGTETVVVVVNLGDQAAAAPALALGDGPLCGRPAATVLLGPDGIAAVEPPTATTGGGFADWRPIAVLGPRETLIVRLAP